MQAQEVHMAFIQAATRGKERKKDRQKEGKKETKKQRKREGGGAQNQHWLSKLMSSSWLHHMTLKVKIN